MVVSVEMGVVVCRNSLSFIFISVRVFPIIRLSRLRSSYVQSNNVDNYWSQAS